MLEGKYKIIPSLLSADVTRLGEEIDAVLQGGADMLHIDVMDNHYVPNITFGPLLCQGIRQRFSDVMLDVHLMTTPVDSLIQQFAKAGANRISIHPNATIHLDRSLQLIKELGCLTGLVLDPATPIDCLEYCIHRLDFVLIMTVNPGFAGQKLIPEVIPKISKLHIRYPTLPICVDGGVTPTNIGNLERAGATEFITGSALFHTENYARTIATMRKQLSYE